jgi:hypothetical protein
MGRFARLKNDRVNPIEQGAEKQLSPEWALSLPKTRTNECSSATLQLGLAFYNIDFIHRILQSIS